MLLIRKFERLFKVRKNGVFVLEIFFSFVLEIFMFLYYCIATIAISDKKFSSSSHVSEKRHDWGKFMNKTILGVQD